MAYQFQNESHEKFGETWLVVFCQELCYWITFGKTLLLRWIEKCNRTIWSVLVRIQSWIDTKNLFTIQKWVISHDYPTGVMMSRFLKSTTLTWAWNSYSSHLNNFWKISEFPYCITTFVLSIWNQLSIRFDYSYYVTYA